MNTKVIILVTAWATLFVVAARILMPAPSIDDFLHEDVSPEPEYFYGDQYKPSSRDVITQQWLVEAEEEWRHPVNQTQREVLERHEKLKKELFIRYGIVVNPPVNQTQREVLERHEKLKKELFIRYGIVVTHPVNGFLED